MTVTGSKRGFASSSATSAATSLVTGGHLNAPIPHLSGLVVRHGETLAVRVGAWGPGTVTLDYRWRRNGRPIPGAVLSTYALTAADVSTFISVTVTGSELGFTTASRTSGSSARIN